MPQECTETVRAFFDAFTNGDTEGFLALLHPRVQWFAAENLLYADQSPYEGPEAVRNLIFDRLLADWEGLTVTPNEILGRGDLVIASGRFRGMYRGNGASIDAQLVQVFQFEDGLISKVQVYTDTAQFKESINRMHSAAT